jgi:PPOX class probable F420-dependent enzyme
MTLKQFEKQQYIALETFRKNGKGVKTPVWFVQDGETLLVWTEAGSGKAKRIRNDSTVRVAPSTGSGEPVGEWLPARAQADECPDTIHHVEKLMKKKYGFIFSVFGFLGRLRLRNGSKYTAIKIQAQ